MNPIINISADMVLPKYEMVLCKLNEEPIMTIQNVEDFEYKAAFGNIDEISFKIPLFRMDSNGEQIENERYHAINGDMLIKVNNVKFFYVHYAKENVSESGEIYKEIQTYSREYELSQKTISGYNGLSRKLYEPVLQGEQASKDEDGLEIGFLNYVEKISAWRVNWQAIDPILLEKYRALNFSKSNLLQAFQEVQKAFGCIFIYNTLNRTIDIFEVDKIGTDKGLYISDRNFLKSIEKSIKSDEIKTRLYLYGKDNISIQTLSITGQPYIENYDFYKNTKYMSQGLIDALDAYDIFITTKQGIFSGYLDTLNTQHPQLTAKTTELNALLGEMKVIETNMDLAIGVVYDTPEEQKIALDLIRDAEASKQAEIQNKTNEITALQGEIDVVYDKIKLLQATTDMHKSLTEAQIRELDSFIKEDTFSDSKYEEEQLDELLSEGSKILSRISQPAIQFSADVVDFMSVVECRGTWDKLRLADKVRLYHKELNFDFLVRMVGYTHSPESNQLTLKFSTTNSMDDNSLYLRDILDGLKTNAATVDFNKYRWDKGENAELSISKFVDSNFDLAKQALVRGDGSQIPIMNERGYWGRSIDENGHIDPYQLRMTNEVIAMTKNDWTDIDIAMSPRFGINANLISGKIGNFATMNANQITVGDGLNDVPILDFIDSELGASMTELETVIDEALSDGQLTNIEANTLKLSLDSVTAESTALIAKAEALLITTPKTNYSTTLSSLASLLNTKWLNKAEYPVSITPAERVEINTRFKALENAKSVLIAAISQKLVDDSNTQLNSVIDGLGIEIDLALSDNSMTNIEANSIKLALDNVTAESTSLLAQAQGLGITTMRTNYLNALNTLTTNLNNNWIGKPEYPIPITLTQRNLIAAQFKALENAKSMLITKVAEEIVNTNAVLVNEPYNYVTISKELGVQVKDQASRERIRLGNYAPGKYGLLIKDKAGVKTILDEDGILQSWQEGRTDNIDSGKPLLLHLFIPANTRIINQAILRFRREKFRAYSTAAATNLQTYGSTSSEDTYNATSSSGGGAYTFTGSGGDVRTWTETTDLTGRSTQSENDSYNYGQHNHGISSRDKLAIFNGAGNAPQYSTTLVASGAHNHGSHDHRITMPTHDHRIDIRDHSHSVRIYGHSHSTTIPGHSHNITYGIYEGLTASRVNITINGYNRTSALGGGSGFNSDQSNLNITSYLNTGTWNTISISGSGMGRIDASVFIQALMNT